MDAKQDRVLLIARDPHERAALVESALEPSGYAVQAVADAGAALTAIRTTPPDVLILDLHLEGLSGRDLLTALGARGDEIPVVLLVDQGGEREALQAFRLGATDFVVRPVREAELVQVVERALKEVRLRREREALLGELHQAVERSERSLRDLHTLMNVGKAIVALRPLDSVLDAAVRAAAVVTDAEAAGLFLRDDTGQLRLEIGHGLPAALEARIGQPVEDDLAALVMSSGETYIASGEGLRRFSPAHAAARAVIYAPLVAHDTVFGLLWVANQHVSFKMQMQDLMTVLADYAALALVNARLVAATQQAAPPEPAAPVPDPAADARAASDAESAAALAERLRGPLSDVLHTVNLFRSGEMGHLRQSHQAAVDVLYRKLDILMAQVEDQLTLPPASQRHGVTPAGDER